MKKILILGGTNFIGRNLVESLLSDTDFELTLLNRGLSNPSLFPKIKRIVSNRNEGDISEIGEESWDYIIDLSCYFPHSLTNIINALTSLPEKYIFISTCSVYEDEQLRVREETARVKEGKPADWIDNQAATYGIRKAECERILRESNINYTILRPALVYGKYDNTDRFYYWLHQVKKYNEILVPNKGTQKFSVTYVKDLIRIIEKSIRPEEDRNIYNVISHPEMSIGKIISTTIGLLSHKPSIINISSEDLSKNNIKQWIDMPLWIDNDFFTFSNRKLLSRFGKVTTAFEKSIEETIQYYEKINWVEPQYGINRNQQVELIDKFKTS